MLYFSLYLTLLFRYWNQPIDKYWQAHFWPFSIVFFGWLLIFYISNLYNLHLAVNNKKFFQLTGRAVLIAVILSMAFFYLTPQITIAPKRNLLIYIIIFGVLFFLWRQLYNLVLKNYLPKNNLAIIGYNQLVSDLIGEVQDKKHLGYNIVFILDDQNQIIKTPAGIKIINQTSQLPRLIKDYKVSSIILTSDPHQSPALRSALFECLHLKINYINLAGFYENFTGKVPLDSVNQMWFLENLNEGSRAWFDKIKRLYDFILAVALFIVSLPLWPIIALIIKVESRGPVFIIMPRLGRGNKQFRLIKFRTMKEQGNDRSPTRANDPRITAFGRILRKTRLDEIPQLINIILGQMSFVGPRPERPELVSQLEKQIPFYHERLLVKPGLTGWDQVSGEYHSPSHDDSIKKLQYDLFYIKNRSIYLDFSIILKTVATVLARKGM